MKANVDRIVAGLAAETAGLPLTALGVTPGWLRSERMLAGFGVTEETWGDACRDEPGFAISESPTYLARGLAALAADPRHGRFAGQVLTSRAGSRRPTASPTPTAPAPSCGACSPSTAGTRRTPT